MKIFHILFFSFFLNGISAAELVRNGQPNASIVLDIAPCKAAQLGALELQYHIEKMTGTRLPITTGRPKEGVRIFVGRSSGEKNFGEQEYLIRVKDNDICLAGQDLDDCGNVDLNNPSTYPDKWKPCATLYAVYDFLERIGFRWYMPTDLGIAFVPSKNLKIGDFELRRTPSVTFRAYSALQFPANLVGDTQRTPPQPCISRKEALLYEFRKRAGGTNGIINHSFYSWHKRFPDKKDWFAHGQGTSPAQLCYSNPEVIAQVVQDARDYFNGKKKMHELIQGIPTNYDSDTYPVVPADDRSWCKCVRCQSLIHKGSLRRFLSFDNQATDYIFTFVNAVARELKKTHPDKFIGTLSYASYYFPPEKVKLEDNIKVRICLKNSVIPHERTENLLREWRKTYPEKFFSIHFYWFEQTLLARALQQRYFPGLTADRAMCDNMKTFRDFRVTGFFAEGPILFYSHKSAALEAIDGTILWECAFDREKDPEELFKEFFSLFFGPAAIPMKAFYTEISTAYADPAVWKENKTRLTPEDCWVRMGNPGRVRKLNSFLLEAKKAAVYSPYKERVEIFDRAIMDNIRQGQHDFAQVEIRRSASMQQEILPKGHSVEPGNPEKFDFINVLPLDLFGGLHAQSLKRNTVIVKVGHDGKWLYLMFEEKCDPKRLQAEKDWYEVFFAGQRAVPFYKTTFFSGGAHELSLYNDSGVHKTGITPRSFVRTGENFWTVYAAIPLSQLIPGGITPGKLLYFNVIRHVSNPDSYDSIHGCWIPTFGKTSEASRFGQLYLKPE